MGEYPEHLREVIAADTGEDIYPDYSDMQPTLSQEEIDRLKKSIADAKEQLDKGLFLPEDASQLRRMIAYYEEQIKEAEASGTN